MKTLFNPLIILTIQWKGSPKYGMIDFPKPLISYNKQGAAMSYDKTISLSLQKEIEKRNLPMESEIKSAMETLKVSRMLARSAIMKKRGYATAVLFYWLILLPFLMKRITSLWSDAVIVRKINARKDTYYRFLNNERFNWRAFIFRLAVRIISINGKTPLKDAVLIIDDTIEKKTGEHMELVSYHFDHTSKRSVLGYQCVQLGYHNGRSFFPLDYAFSVSQNRPNRYIRTIGKRTQGYKRRKEAEKKKTDLAIDMVSRAYAQGIDASFVLFDSWYSHDSFISNIMNIGYGVICRLKKGRVNYTYQGKSYTLKQLWQNTAKKMTRSIHGFPYKGVCLKVLLPKSGEVSLLFVSDGKKEWHAFLCTDTEYDPSQILSLYARRWAIEVFFKDGKQLLYMGKEQSETFDAAIAAYGLVVVRYLILVYILNKYHSCTSCGPLFKELVKTHCELLMMNTIWSSIKEVLILSSGLFLTEIDSDRFLSFLDIVEDAILMQEQKISAKL